MGTDRKPPRQTTQVKQQQRALLVAQKAMEEARALAATKSKYEPITVKQLAVQEGLSPTDARRKLALASLPQQVQQLVEQRQLAIMSAESIARANLEPSEKIALASKFVDGTANGESREAVQETIRVMSAWTPQMRHEFLTDPAMTFTEARERYKEQERQHREREALEQRRAAERRSRNHHFQWVSLDIVDHCNGVMKRIVENPGQVDPLARRSAIEALRDTVLNAALALATLEDEQGANQALARAQNALLRTSTIGSANVVTGEIVTEE